MKNIVNHNVFHYFSIFILLHISYSKLINGSYSPDSIIDTYGRSAATNPLSAHEAYQIGNKIDGGKPDTGACSLSVKMP